MALKHIVHLIVIALGLLNEPGPVTQTGNIGLDQALERVDVETVALDNKRPHSASLRMVDDAADELQKEIDQLRKKFKELEKKMKSSTDPAELQKLQDQIQDMQLNLKTLYDKIDSITQDQQQKFKQEMDKFYDEMVKANTDLSDRVTKLEKKIEQDNINNVVGSIRQGLNELALSTFKNLEHPLLAMPVIITQSYNNELEQCGHVLDFIVNVQVVTTNHTIPDRLRASSYTTFYTQLKPDQFTEKGSDCVLKMAYQAFQAWTTVFDYSSAAQFFFLFKSMPISVESIIRQLGSHFRRDLNGCNFTKDEKQDYTNKGYVGDLFIGTCLTPDQGDYFQLQYPSTQNLEGNSNGDVFLGNPDPSFSNADQLWKIQLISNQRVHIKHKATGKPLYWESVDVDSCYKYKLSDTQPQGWYVTP